MRRGKKSAGFPSEAYMASISRPRRSLYLDSLLCHREEQLEETLTPSPANLQSSMSGLKREDSPEQVNAGNEPPAAGRERRSSFSSSTTGDSGYGGSVLGQTFLEHKTVQHFESGDDYLFAMIEDLAEWFSNLYDMDVSVDSLFGQLDSGVLLCRHAHEVQKAGEEYIKLNQRRDLPMKVGNQVLVIPQAPPNYRANAQPSTFVARDNVANFIHWCRAFGIPDCLSFETEDLVLRKNVRSVILCLLEIARVGAKVGMEAPDLVMMEEEIDAEIEADAARARAENGEEEEVEYEDVEEEFEEEEEGLAVPDEALGMEVSIHEDPVPAEDTTDFLRPRTRLRKRMVRRPKQPVRPPYQPPPLIPQPLNNPRRQRPRPKCDMRSLDEMVRDIIKECSCDETFPMKRLGEGKYQFGDNSTLIFVRILRYHVMVRVGGGWDTLNHFLEKYDPCRKGKCHSDSTKSAPCRHSGSFGTRTQSEEPQPLRTSTPRKTPAASTLDELQQRPTAVNRNFKEGQMNVVRMRNRTASVDAGLARTQPPPRPPINRNSEPKSEPKPEVRAEGAEVQLRVTRPIDQMPQEPVDRIGSLYLHNTVDDLRRCLSDFQSSIQPTAIPKPRPVTLPSPSGDSEALSAREMYQRMQRDFEMMRMGVDVPDMRPKDEDAISVASTCSSTSSAATTGSRRLVSRIPIPVRYSSPRSNPTTPELQRRAPRPPVPSQEPSLARRKSMDSGRSRPNSANGSRRGSVSAVKSSGGLK